MPENSNVVLHVGFSKTATTSLQVGVFARHSELINRGKPYTDPACPIYRSLRHIIFAESIDYQESECREVLARLVGDASSKGQTLLISHEGFSYGRHNDRGLVAERLHSIFGEACILFTIREPLSWICSLYLDDARRFLYSRPQTTFNRWLVKERKMPNRGALEIANYYNVINLYVDLFSRENVHVLLFEEMLHHPHLFSQKLSQICNIGEKETLKLLLNVPRMNPRLTKRAYRFGVINYFLVPNAMRLAVDSLLPDGLKAKMRSFIESGDEASIEFPDGVAALVAESFREANRKLADQFGLDLACYGYPL